MRNGSRWKVGFMPSASIRKFAISAATRLVLMAASLVLQDSSGTRQDAPAARPTQRPPGIRTAAHEAPLPVVYAGFQPGRMYLDLAVRAYQRQQRHAHCPRRDSDPQGRGGMTSAPEAALFVP